MEKIDKKPLVIAFAGAGGKTTTIHEYAEAFRKEGRRVFITTSTNMAVEEDTMVDASREAMARQLTETGYLFAGRLKQPGKLMELEQDDYKYLCGLSDVVLIEADGSKRLPVKYPNATEPVIYDNVDYIVLIMGANALGRPIKDVMHRYELACEEFGFSPEENLTPDHIKLLISVYLKRYKGYNIKVEIRQAYSDSDKAAAKMLEALSVGA